MVAVVWAVTRVEERVVEVNEVVRLSRPRHGGWVVMATEGGVAVRVDVAAGWEAKRFSTNNNRESSSSSNFQLLEQQQ